MTFKRIEEVTVASTEVSYGGEILIDGTVQVRKCTISKDAGGKEISKKLHRHVLHPGDDYSKEPQEVKDVCAVEHTPAKISDRAAFVLAQKENV